MVYHTYELLKRLDEKNEKREKRGVNRAYFAQLSSSVQNF